jgi:ApaG protein
MYKEVTNEILVNVAPAYDPERSMPQESYYFFTYTITITNQSSKEVQLLDRHWIITDGNGHLEEVKGEGVVGETPIIPAGESFTYTSACPLPTKTGNMRGTYGMLDNKKKAFRITIPLFFLRTPDSFH